MKTAGPKTKSLWPLLALTALLIVLLAQPAQADTKQWVGTLFNNLWTDPNNWSPAGEPGIGDEVYLTQNGFFPKTVIYNSSSNPLLTSLTVNATGWGTITLKQSENALSASDEVIGYDGTGRFTQIGGTNTVSYRLHLGNDPTGVGTYNLSDTGSLSAGIERVGNFGTGTFKQSGGTHTVDYNLSLGFGPKGVGTYNLSGSGSLVVKLSEYIGVNGLGTFNQTGGTHTVFYNLFLGNDPTGVGTYNLSGGSLSVSMVGASGIVVGRSGAGTFNHGTLPPFGGTNTITENLYLGGFPFQVSEGDPAGSGTYNLSGTGSLSANYEYIGYSGTGTFNQIGGTNTVISDLILGNLATSSGKYKMFGGSLSVGGDEYIGKEGTGSFSHFGGANAVTNNLFLGFETGSSGTYHLNLGSLSAYTEYIGNIGTGSFSQFGGTNKATYLVLGNGTGGSGTYHLNFGYLEAVAEGIGEAGTGSFTQIGGTNKVTSHLDLGVFPQSSGTYNLKLGTLSVGNYEIIGREGTGVFNQTGGIHKVANQLELAASPSSSATYNFLGGTLSTGSIRISQPGGTFNITGISPTITGPVTNFGTVKTTNANVTWTGTFTNYGAYISDPSIQTFNQDLVVDTAIGLSSSGYLVGHSHDLFVVKGDFINKSTNTTDWNTAQATLKFAKDAGGDTDHQFYIPGADNGDSGTNEFAWHTLNILGQTVHLMDGNPLNSTTSSDGAQYVKVLLGAEVDWATKVVKNIFNDEAGGTLNIYYDPKFLANIYLLGLDYTFAGGSGMLIADPVPTPLPPSMLLLGSGLLGLGLLGRRRKRG